MAPFERIVSDPEAQLESRFREDVPNRGAPSIQEGPLEGPLSRSVPWVEFLASPEASVCP
jgi:hypothetical protein